MSSIFISYSSQERDLVKGIAGDLDDLGHEVWFDHELTGGHEWWADILQSIRACDLFVFAMSHESLESYPCTLEYKYAYALQKRILPVLVADANVALLPFELSKIQFVDYRQKDMTAVKALARALGNLSPAQALPDPLPEPPPAPISQLGRLTERIAAPELSFQEQTAMLFELKELMSDPDNAENARVLLQRLQGNSDVRASIDHEISALLTQAQPTVPQPQAAPAKASSIRRTPTRGVDRTNGSADGTRRQSALAFLRDHRLLLWRGIGAFLGSVVALGISSINAHPDYAKLLPLLIIPAAILALGLVVLTQLPKPGQPLQAAWPRLLIASIIFSITLFLGLNLLAISVNYPQLVSGYTLLWGVIIGIGGALVCWRTTQLFRRILFLSLITMVGDVFANYASGNTPDLFGLFVGPPLLYALTFSPELVQYIAQRVRRSSG